jgi:putative transposase
VKSPAFRRRIYIFAKNIVMQTYKSCSHTRYDIKYHIVWITKYRRPILEGSVADRVRELIRQICMQHEVTIIKGHVSKDHIHILVSTTPKMSISQFVQKIKGTSSHKLFQEYAHLRKQYWGQHLWSHTVTL